jgi:hypothetical protein
MGLGTSLNKKWRHQIKTMKWAIYFIRRVVHWIYLQEKQNRNGPSISCTQLSSENAFKQHGKHLATWAWELLNKKNPASSQTIKLASRVNACFRTIAQNDSQDLVSHCFLRDAWQRSGASVTVHSLGADIRERFQEVGRKLTSAQKKLTKLQRL